MSVPSVLIVGAGAMGMVAGYHLALGGTQVSFLVRPGRLQAFSAPQRLYCYDDHQLKLFENYEVFDQVEQIAGRNFDYVISTLDGASARTPEASATLGALGFSIAKKLTMLVIGGVGVGLREHYLETTGLPTSRVLNGALALLSHQVSAGLPLHAATDAKLLASASMAYHHFPNRLSFLIDSTYPQAAKRFAEIYNRSGVSRCGLINRTLYAIMSNAAFPMLAASDIAGWPSVDALVANRELWQLSCRAQSEIAALPQHGWIGRLVSLLLTDGLSARLQRKIEQDSWPLNYQAFNRFHHGGKVKAQDVQVMQNCLASGQRQGRAMPALAELLRRWEAVPVTGRRER